MTTTKPRTMRRAVSVAEKERRRDDILAAAKKVFARKGYASTTIADIAKAARLSYGSIYWYFDSKDALFHELMDAEERALRDAVGSRLSSLPPGTDGVTFFRAAVTGTLEFFESDKALVRLLFRDAHSLGGRFERHLGAIYERFIDDIEATIAAAQRRGDIIDAPPRMIAFTVAALIGQIALRRLSTDDGLEASVVAEFIVTLVLDGLRPR
jgi:AcrR family transcriptional regulator